MPTFVINADSTPLYDSFGWADYWGCAEWIQWYNALKTKYNTDQANYIWSKAWLDGVSVAGGGYGNAPGSGEVYDSVPIDCRTFDQNFKDFLASNTALKSAVYTGIGGLIAKPLGLGVDVINTTTNIGEKALGAADKSATVLEYAIPVILILILLFLLYLGFSYANNATKKTSKA